MGRAWLRIVLRKHFCGKSSCQRKILTLKAAFVNNWIKCSVIHNNIMSRSWTYILTLIFWTSTYDQNDQKSSKFSLFPYNSVSRLPEVPDQKVVRIDMILNQELPNKRELNTFQNPWKNNFFYCVELKMPIFQLFLFQEIFFIFSASLFKLIFDRTDYRYSAINRPTIKWSSFYSL